MKKYKYNPFSREIHSLKAEDLLVLKSISEGWYIDYKQELINIKKISKHLSSFANQYGGWLFFGIKESSDKCAGEFSGIPFNEVENARTAIREAASAHSNPEVYYEEKVINGPIEDVGLEVGNSIIIIYIPEGVNPPYIHSSGRIYRRVGDSADPKHENDRYALEHLINKNKKHSKQLKKFVSFNELHVEDKTPVINIYFITNPHFNESFDVIDFDDFKSVCTTKDDSLLHMPMPTVYSCRGGYIAKHTENNDQLSRLPLLKWFHDGNAMLSIPINILDTNSLFNEKYDTGILFYDTLEENKLHNARVCDLNYFVTILVALYGKLKYILEKTSNNNKMFSAVIMENFFHVIPYLDDPVFITQIKNNGIPVIEDQYINIPSDVDFESLIKLSFKTKLDIKSESEGAESFGVLLYELLPIIANIFNSTGIIYEDKDITKFVKLFTPYINNTDVN